MTIYINNKKDAVLTSVEFTPTIDGNFSFFHVKDDKSLEEARKQVAAFGESIIAETKVNGTPMLVTRGKRTDYSTLNALQEAGNHFEIPKPDHGLKPWKLRGWASMIGQPLQLISAFLTKPNGIDAGIAGFASLNMIANISNIVFGAEQTKDTNQLRFLKKKFNYELSQYLPNGSSSKLPSSYDDRMHLRQGKEKPPGVGTKVYNFMKRHSVSFCEIGLRYAGSVMLIFPIDKWKKGFSAFGDGLKTKGYTASMIDGGKAALNSDPWSAMAGTAYVAGKSLAFTTKIKDPYDTKPHTWLDTVREKYVFPISSGIEAVAAGIISWNSLFMKRIELPGIGKKMEGLFNRIPGIVPQKWMNWAKQTKNLAPLTDLFGNPVLRKNPNKTIMMKDNQPVFAHKSTRDWFGGIGGALFTMGLVIRMFASYGHKEVDMKELNAHLVDGLSQVPRDKLPELIANFSAYLTEHFKGQVEFGEVYKELTDGLYRYHQIALPGLNAAHDSQNAIEQTQTNGKEAPPRTFARDDMKADRPTAASSHAERAASAPENAAALGA